MEQDTLNIKIVESFSTVKPGQIYRSVIDHAERILIETALEQAAGNQIVAARVLGLNRNTLRSKIKKLNIVINKYK